MSQLQLSGTKVLDLSRVLAGPLAASQLGDLGADVIKVERAGVGDETRRYGPPFDDRGESAYYLSCNRNKLGVAVNLDLAADIEMVSRLAADADVVIDNFLPGALTRRGLDAARFVSEHQRLVWCTIGGFARDRLRPGYDYVAQAESGWMSITGPVDGDPMKVGVALADVLTAKEAAIAILAALSGVRAGREVQRHVMVNLFESAVGALINVAQNSLVTGRPTRRWGNAHPNLVPYELFHAADQPMVIAVGNDAQFASLARVLGDPTLGDERFAGNAGRVKHRDEVVGAIRARIATRRAEEWLTLLRDAEVPSGRVNSVEQAIASVASSPLTGVAPQAPGMVRRRAPTLDEHGALVRAHGWDAFAHA